MFALFGIFAQSDGMAFEESQQARCLRSAGLSYGGLNTMQALTRNSDVFAVGVANAPVFNHISSVRYEGYPRSAPFDLEPPTGFGFRSNPMGPGSDLAGPEWAGLAQKNQQLAWDSSPAGHILSLTSPLLVIQGDSDANVVFQQTVGIVRALRRQGLESQGKLETLVVPDERHGFRRYVNQMLAANATMSFFARRLAFSASSFAACFASRSRCFSSATACRAAARSASSACFCAAHASAACAESNLCVVSSAVR